MRQVTYRDVTVMKEYITIEGNEAGAGGASTEYDIHVDMGDNGNDTSNFRFQTGNPAEEVNGLTNEALLSVVLDRLQGFAKGPFPSRETSIAITKIEEALHWMHSRSLEREDRGVLGKLIK